MTNAESTANVNKDLQNANEDIEAIEQKCDTVADSNSDGSENDSNSANAENEVDYAAVVEEDIRTLREEFRELSSLTDICELDDPMRYAALRDLGLTPAEAYLATARKRRGDNRSHLHSSVPKHSAFPGPGISESELTAAREIFPDMSDNEIRQLYRKVK